MTSENTPPTTAAVRAARALEPTTLLTYVTGRRWFGAKSGAPTAVQLVDAVPLPWEDGAFALCRLDVTTSSGVQRYQLPLAVRPALPDGATPIADGAEGGVVFDAVEDPAFRRHLASAFGRGCTIAFDGGRWVIAGAGATPLVLPADAEVALGSAEQSNTSMRIGGAAILKLFRRVEAGEHPDVEITRFLTTGRNFPNTPVLLGTLHWESADGTTTVGGMLQELVPEASDAWAYALETGRPYFTAPRDHLPEDRFARDAAQLGRVTRAMHEALASDAALADFAPEPVDRATLEQWAAHTRQQVEGALALLERQVRAGGLKGERLEEARIVVGRRARYAGLADEIVARIGDDAGQRIRHHGDYHLGQVLRTAAGEFMVIDFEGEPARPLDERRRKHGALRDVAGMLRSFAYASATLAMDARAGSGGLDPATVELRAGRWERDAREAFLKAYFGDAAAGFLPRDAAHARQLLMLFEVEKVFYELAYELNNRPDWVGIPLRGIARLTGP